MQKFLKRFVYFSILPLLFLAFISFFYFKNDIFSDFGYHKNYSWKYSFQALGDISTKKLLKNHTIKYNSFIFGSSRTTGIFACYLQKRIPSSKFFHYANWNETIGGIYAKVKLLDSMGYDINNVIIYFDTDFTFANGGYVKGNDHYLLTHESVFNYYYSHFGNFLPPNLESQRFKVLLGYKIKELCPNWESDTITNDPTHICSDSTIKGYGNFIFSKKHLHLIDSLKKIGFLYKRNQGGTFKPMQISAYDIDLLKKVEAIFAKHKTRYYIVITPLYDQLKFNQADMLVFNNIFGNHVYDFSGINKFTNNEYNYPDRKHFLPYISKTIIDSIIVSK